MRIIATLLAALLLFSGCTDDPEPKEPKKSSTPKPTATVPTLPPEAKADTEDGAVAFVKHYIDVFNYASNTGDVKQLQALSDPKCEGCTSYIEHFQSTYDAGGYFRDTGWKVRSARVVKGSKPFDIFVEVDAPETTFRTDKKAKEQVGESGKYELFFNLAPGPKLGTFERVEGDGP